MNRNDQKKSGVTLVEISVGVIIISIIMAIVMNLFSAGLRGSSKGMANLTNMEASAVLMSQIEYDLLRAVKIVDPATGGSDTVARWDICGKSSAGNGTIIYNQLPGGIERQFVSSEGNQKHVFCKGLKVGIVFRHLCFEDAAKDVKKAGMWIELSVASSKKSNTSEEFKIKRLVLCKNIVESELP